MKKCGIILCVFLVVGLISKFLMFIMGTTTSSFMWALIETVIMLVLIILYFVTNKVKNPILIYGICVEYAVRQIVLFLQDATGMQTVFFVMNVLVMLASVCLTVLIGFLAYQISTSNSN